MSTLFNFFVFFLIKTVVYFKINVFFVHTLIFCVFLDANFCVEK